MLQALYDMCNNKPKSQNVNRRLREQKKVNMTARSSTEAGLHEPAPPRPQLLTTSRSVAITATLAIFGIGGFLRLWQLGAVGYNSDKAVSPFRPV
jgi:hypothetical protein